MFVASQTIFWILSQPPAFWMYRAKAHSHTHLIIKASYRNNLAVDTELASKREPNMPLTLQHSERGRRHRTTPGQAPMLDGALSTATVASHLR